MHSPSLIAMALTGSLFLTPGCGDGAPAGGEDTSSGAGGDSSVGASGTNGSTGGGAGQTMAVGGAGAGGASVQEGAGGKTGGAGAGGSAGGSAGGAGSGGSTGACSGAKRNGSAKGTPGVWEEVSPAEADIASTGNGAETVLVDAARPSDVYVCINTRGVWKSTDYGTTWKKANTGTNGDKINGGGFPYGAIDLDPCRDPATSPAIYVTQLFGAGGLWKSIDGAVSWTSVWNKNIFGADGVTDISADVGSDVHSVHVVTPSQKDHLIVALHGYGGSGGNNGVFESTDGGGKWIVHKSSTFSFQPHNDVLFPIDASIWMVTPGTVSSRLNMFRTADGAGTWTDLGEAPARAIGRSLTHAGSTFYAGTDYNSNVVKSTDQGATWTKLANSGGQISWVVTTATKVYASGGYTSDATIRHANLSNDSAWMVDRLGTGQGKNGNGHDAKVTFDGTHYIIIAAQHNAGIWRYVEP